MSLTDPLGLKRRKNRKKKAEYFEPQWRSDIEQRELEVSLKTATIRFNRAASYVIQFTLIESFADNYDGVTMKVDDGEYGDGHGWRSELIQPTEIGTRIPFEHTISFNLPKGYCKNDGRHDVHVRLEAYEATSRRPGDVKLNKLVGQSIYPVYPRPKAPAIDLNPQPGKPMLRDNVILPLLRTPNTDQKVMHCGDLAFSVVMNDRNPGGIPAIRISTATGDQTDRTDGATTVISRSPMPPSPVPPLALGDQQQQGKRPSVAPSVGNQLTVQGPDRRQSQVSVASTVTKVSRQRNVQNSPQMNDPFPDTRSDPDEVLEEVPELQVGEVLEGKPRKKRQSFRSLHDIKFLKPDALGKAFGDEKNYYSEMSHVSHPGTEKIDIILHSACSLPERSNDRNLPRPFVAVSTTMGFLQNEIQSFTHISKNPGSCATWGELCTTEFDGVTIANEALVLAIVDKETLEIMAYYSIPVTYMTPYQQYHLELNLPRRHGINCRLYASVMRKLPQIPHEHMGPAYGIEVLLRHFDAPLSIDPGPLICVARIIPDYTPYIAISPTNSRFGVNPRRITFPLPKASAFIENDKQSVGNPQVSLPSNRPAQPSWNYPYLFATSRDKATIFTPGAALLLEFYQFFMQTSEAGWDLKNPIGHAIVPVDMQMFNALSKSATQLGISISGIPVLSQNLRHKDGRTPTVTIAVRLLSPHAVDTLATQSRAILESLTPVDIHPFIHELRLNCKTMAYKYSSPCPNEKNAKPNSAKIMAQTNLEPQAGSKIMHLVPKFNPNNVEEIVEEYRVKVLSEKIVPRPALNLQLNEGELPPSDAMQSILPEYRYMLEGGRGVRGLQPHILRQMGDDPANLTINDTIRRANGQSPGPPVNNPIIGNSSLNSILIPVNADTMAVAELDQYRRAVRRMGEDILALRREMAGMSSENTKLANQLAHYDELTRTVLSTQVIEGLSKAELADRYVASRQQLITQEEALQQYKARIQKLHNELIRRNDREVENAHVRQAHAAQQAIIQRLQEKASRYDKLVETVRHQELVIERMERVLTTRLKEIPDLSTLDVNSVQRDAYDTVVEENGQLRRQIEEMRIINEATGQAQSEVDAERLQMMQAMDRMEARIVALEKELEDRSREWGRERAELVIKLNEQHRGFSPTKMSPTRISPTSPPRFGGGSFSRFTVAETSIPPPTAFPGLAASRAHVSGVGGTLLGRAKAG